MYKVGDIVVVRDDANLERVGLQREHIPPGEWTVLEPNCNVHGLVRVRHRGRRFAEWNLGEEMIEPVPEYFNRIREELKEISSDL